MDQTGKISFFDDRQEWLKITPDGIETNNCIIAFEELATLSNRLEELERMITTAFALPSHLIQSGKFVLCKEELTQQIQQTQEYVSPFVHIDREAFNRGRSVL